MMDSWSVAVLEAELQQSTQCETKFVPATEEQEAHNKQHLQQKDSAMHLIMSGGGYNARTMTIPLPMTHVSKSYAESMAEHLATEWCNGKLVLNEGSKSHALPPRVVYGGQRGKEMDDVLYTHTAHLSAGKECFLAQSNALLIETFADKEAFDKFCNTVKGAKGLCELGKSFLTPIAKEQVSVVCVQLLRPALMGGLEIHSDSEDFQLPLDFAVSWLLSGPIKSTHIVGSDEDAKFFSVGEGHVFDPSMYHRSGSDMTRGSMQVTFFYVKKSNMTAFRQTVRAVQSCKWLSHVSWTATETVCICVVLRRKKSS